MVLEQHIYETNIDFEACSRSANESPHVKHCNTSRKGHLNIRFHKYNGLVQITPKGRLMVYVDSSDFENLWKILMPMLRTKNGGPVKIKWLKRITHPDNIRLRALMHQEAENGSIESQLSVINELQRMREKPKSKPQATGVQVQE